MKIKVIEAVNQLGLGGTEYALQLYCKYFDKELFEVTVVSLLKGGERVRLIEELGVEVIVLNGDLTRLPALLKKTDVFHWHGSGSCDQDKALFSLLQANKPKLVIQTNVFGSYDHSPFYNLIDYDLYISKMILIRRMKLDKKSDKFEQKRKVLPYPVDVDAIKTLLPSEEQILKFRSDNNLDDLFIIGRIGRADDQKFDPITLEAFAEFSKKNRNTRFLLVGATPAMKQKAEQLQISDKLLILDNTADMRQLLVYYAAMDVFLAASLIGESFGMVIAEAMSVGTPVVTISTEDRDNAQIELMDNEISGLVVRRDKRKIAGALNYLYKNKDVIKRLAGAARMKIEKDYKAQKIVASLEDLILRYLTPGNSKMTTTLLQGYSKELINEYSRRCANLYGSSKITKKLKEIFGI